MKNLINLDSVVAEYKNDLWNSTRTKNSIINRINDALREIGLMASFGEDPYKALLYKVLVADTLYELNETEEGSQFTYEFLREKFNVRIGMYLSAFIDNDTLVMISEIVLDDIIKFTDNSVKGNYEKMNMFEKYLITTKNHLNWYDLDSLVDTVKPNLRYEFEILKKIFIDRVKYFNQVLTE